MLLKPGCMFALPPPNETLVAASAGAANSSPNASSTPSVRRIFFIGTTFLPWFPLPWRAKAILPRSRRRDHRPIG